MNVRHRCTAPGILALVALGACDLPSEAPILEHRWILPVEGTAIGVSDLLPDDVTDRGETFDVALAARVSQITLGEACAGCAAANGLTVPKPAFSTSISVSKDLPARVEEVELADASIDITIRNGFSFDPLRPGGETGILTITITDGPGGTQLGQTVLDGSTRALPAGSETHESVALTGSVTSSFHAVVAVTSPAGGPVTIDASESLEVRAPAGQMPLRSATVAVAGEELTIEPVDLDSGDLDEEFTSRIENGAVLLDIANPFGVSAAGQLEIAYPGGRLAKNLEIASGNSSVTVSFTGDELRSFLGVDGAVLTGTTTITPTAAPIVLRPGQEVHIGTRIDLTIRVGG